MSLLIQKTEIYDPKVNKCICGGDVEHNSHQRCDSGSAWIICRNCKIEMVENSDHVGYYGVTLLGMYKEVVRRWNNVMSSII